MQIQITANKLAEFVSAKTPERRMQIVRQLKFSTGGHPVYYTLFHAVAKRFLMADATDALDILRLIDRLKTRTQSDWYARDSRITAEALRALIKAAPQLRKLNVSFVAAGKNSKTKLEFSDVHVTVTPNLLIHGERDGRQLIGALRFYIAKESTYNLGQRAAELVAVMEYLWLKRIATDMRTPATDLCLVLECFQQRVTSAPSDIAFHVARLERGCHDFVHIWRLLDDQKAA